MSTKAIAVLTEDEARQILASRSMFDMAAPLTDDELTLMGATPARLVEKEATSQVHTIEEDQFAQTENLDAVDLEMNGQSYNGRYAQYLRWQALVTLASFEEGWSVFQEQVLKAYVRDRRRENREYRGDDPNRAHALRLREQAAEDFVNFVNNTVAEAAATPKPILKK